MKLVHAEHRDLWGVLVAALRPPPRMKPSAWSETHVTLTREQSEAKPGPFSCDWKPWTRDLHDLLDNEPAKKGLIFVKPARVGMTRAVVNLLGCYAHTRPCSMLFLIDTKEQATYWASEHFDKLVRSVPALRKSFAEASTDRRETMIQLPFIGGRIDFAGAGSAGSLTSRGYEIACLDEYERILDEWPKKWGSPLTAAEARVSAAKDRSKIMLWSHPRRAGEGIDDLWLRMSDRRRWTWDCPHCEAPIQPHSSMVHMAASETGDLDPETAVFRCPHCGEVIEDRDRARAVWPARLGGTGRFQGDGELTERQAARREYIGIAVHGLDDPTTSVYEFAAGRAMCSDEAELQAWHNQKAGEAYTMASQIVTPDVVTDRLNAMKSISVPGGDRGAQLVTCGVDVQAPEGNPTLYLRATAWTTMGFAFVVAYLKLTGWSALVDFLERAMIARTGPDGQTEDYLVPSLCSIDCGFATRQVLDFARRSVHSRHTNTRIALLPLRFQPYVKSTTPAVMPSEQKRIDPARPYLGPQVRYDLHRHSWVDREMRRWIEGRIEVICPAPGDLAAHITANVLAPKWDPHGFGNDEVEWRKQKGRRDDWAMAGAFDEAGAVLACHLERLSERVAATVKPRRVPDEGEGARPGGWLGSVQRGSSWW